MKIIVITVNVTAIKAEPRAILYGLINAVKTVFITVRNKLRKTVIILAEIKYGASVLLP